MSGVSVGLCLGSMTSELLSLLIHVKGDSVVLIQTPEMGIRKTQNVSLKERITLVLNDLGWLHFMYCD